MKEFTEKDKDTLMKKYNLKSLVLLGEKGDQEGELIVVHGQESHIGALVLGMMKEQEQFALLMQKAVIIYTSERAIEEINKIHE